MKNIRKEIFKIRSYEMDAQGKATVQTICNYLQEIAGLHAAALGVSVTDLIRNKMTWVLSRLHLIIDRYPEWNADVHVETWPSGAKGLYATRDFTISDAGNNVIGVATSSWMIVDLVKQKPIELPEFVHAIRLPDKKRAIDDPFKKLHGPKQVDFEKQFNVRRSDLDINQHVNNVNYIEWAIESTPIDIYRKKNLTELEISFRAESKYGDRIIAQSEVHEDNCLYKLTRLSDGRELAVVRTRWK